MRDEVASNNLRFSIKVSAKFFTQKERDPLPFSAYLVLYDPNISNVF